MHPIAQFVIARIGGAVCAALSAYVFLWSSVGVFVISGNATGVPAVASNFISFISIAAPTAAAIALFSMNLKWPRPKLIVLIVCVLVGLSSYAIKPAIMADNLRWLRISVWFVHIFSCIGFSFLVGTVCYRVFWNALDE